MMSATSGTPMNPHANQIAKELQRVCPIDVLLREAEKLGMGIVGTSIMGRASQWHALRAVILDKPK